LEDWARKTSLEIVELSKKLGYAVAREDLKGLINSLRKIKNKDHRTKLIITGYARLGHREAKHKKGGFENAKDQSNSWGISDHPVCPPK